MSWTDLPTNYTNATWTGNRKYQMIDNGDNTYSFVDVTNYTNRENSFFAAGDANAMNGAVNTLMASVADPDINPTITLDNTPCAGFVTGVSKQVLFLIPYNILNCSVSVTNLSISIRAGLNHQYLYEVSGSGNTQLGTNVVSIWANGASVRANGVDSISVEVRPRCGLYVRIYFHNALLAEDHTTTAQNNMPISIMVSGTFALS